MVRLKQLEAAWRRPEQSGRPLPPIEARLPATNGSGPTKSGEPPWRALLILAGVAFLAYGAWYSWGPRTTPAGQPPLAQITPAGITRFEAQVNAQADHPRVLLLLSPT